MYVTPSHNKITETTNELKIDLFFPIILTYLTFIVNPFLAISVNCCDGLTAVLNERLLL